MEQLDKCRHYRRSPIAFRHRLIVNRRSQSLLWSFRASVITHPSRSGSRSDPGLTVEEHLARLRDGLIPLAERCGRVMREAINNLEVLRAAPSQAVERSRPVRISVVFEPRVLP
jgi:hypothetical protein